MKIKNQVRNKFLISSYQTSNSINYGIEKNTNIDDIIEFKSKNLILQSFVNHLSKKGFYEDELRANNLKNSVNNSYKEDKNNKSLNLRSF